MTDLQDELRPIKDGINNVVNVLEIGVLKLLEGILKGINFLTLGSISEEDRTRKVDWLNNPFERPFKFYDPRSSGLQWQTTPQGTGFSGYRSNGIGPHGPLGGFLLISSGLRV